jgi:hypothetical protein
VWTGFKNSEEVTYQLLVMRIVYAGFLESHLKRVLQIDEYHEVFLYQKTQNGTKMIDYYEEFPESIQLYAEVGRAAHIVDYTEFIGLLGGFPLGPPSDTAGGRVSD